MKIYKKILIFITVITFLFIINVNLSAQNDTFSAVDEHNNLRFGNEYIVIVVNQNDNAMGRFAVETTGGAPLREDDMNKPLIYGRPTPWTSYTTLWLNGEKYVFGGQTQRRAGKDAKYGEVIQEPTLEDGQIITKTQFDNIVVEQILSIVRSSTTGLADTAQIKYRIINEGEEREKVGLRLMIDTMLGENDGAPFRLGEDTISTDTLYYDKQLETFWQAFDSISNPQVTSQGTLIGPNVTTPDRVYFSDWGSLADGVWDFNFNPGEEFIRRGEFEIDSAMAMYWVPDILEAGESKTIISNYGLGGITIVPGILSLGVTSPAEVTFNENNRSFPVVAYLENTSDIEARNVRAELDLPDNFEANNISREIGDLEAGGISQINWNVRPKDYGDIPEAMTYRVVVEADNTDSNEVERRVEFLGPPILEADISLMEEVEAVDGKLEPNPFKVQANISNVGETALYGVEAELILAPGLDAAASERLTKHLGILDSNERLNVNWLIQALRVDGKLPFAVKVSGINEYEKTIVEEIELPELSPLIYLRENPGQRDQNYLSIDIVAANIGEAEFMEFDFSFDNENLLLSHISRGDFFIGENNLLPFNRPERLGDGNLRFEQELPYGHFNGVIATVHFRKRTDSIGNIQIENLSLLNADNNEIEIMLRNIIKEEE